MFFARWRLIVCMCVKPVWWWTFSDFFHLNQLFTHFRLFSFNQYFTGLNYIWCMKSPTFGLFLSYFVHHVQSRRLHRVALDHVILVRCLCWQTNSPSVLFPIVFVFLAKSWYPLSLSFIPFERLPLLLYSSSLCALFDALSHSLFQCCCKPLTTSSSLRLLVADLFTHNFHSRSTTPITRTHRNSCFAIKSFSISFPSDQYRNIPCAICLMFVYVLLFWIDRNINREPWRIPLVIALPTERIFLINFHIELVFTFVHLTIFILPTLRYYHHITHWHFRSARARVVIELERDLQHKYFLQRGCLRCQPSTFYFSLSSFLLMSYTNTFVR